MDKYFICMWDKFIFGGIETYYMQMFKWAKKNGYKLILLIPLDAEYDSGWNQEINKHGIRVIRYAYRCRSIDLKELGITSFSYIKFVTACIHDFLLANNIRRFQRKKIDVIFYVLHPLLISGDASNVIKRTIYSILFIRPLWGNGLVFMDNYSYTYMLEMYHFKKTKFSNPKIILPGREIVEKSKEIMKNKIIFSACRMVFPFKEYVLSLIDDFEILANIYSDIELVLVGDGENYQQLIDRINKLEDWVKNKIYLLGNLEYNEMMEKMQKAYVFVGHGTTLLDAASLGVPSIIATSYQSEGFAVGYWDDMPECLGVMKNSEGWNRYKCFELLVNVLEENVNQHLDRSLKTKKVLEDYYDIEKNMKKIMELKTYYRRRFSILKIILDVYSFIWKEG